MIGNYEYENCTSLKTIKIPASLTSIGEGEFEGCTSLIEVEIPLSITTMNENDFEKCTKIEEIKISAMAAAVSNTWTALTDMEEDPGVIAKFSKKTGVKGRYDANLNQTTADFCFAAAKAILKEKKISPNEIGILVFARTAWNSQGLYCF